jgi:hypothetical protein
MDPGSASSCTIRASCTLQPTALIRAQPAAGALDMSSAATPCCTPSPSVARDLVHIQKIAVQTVLPSRHERRLGGSEHWSATTAPRSKMRQCGPGGDGPPQVRAPRSPYTTGSGGVGPSNPAALRAPRRTGSTCPGGRTCARGPRRQTSGRAPWWCRRGRCSGRSTCA